MRLSAPDAALAAFADSVGPTDPVVPVGGRTQWSVGGVPDEAAREVRPPAGVVSHQPADMTVRVRAGTPVAQLDDVLSDAGQMVPLDPLEPGAATVGGVLSVGHAGLRRLRWGPPRDAVLEVTYVSAEGKLVRAGGPVVKNVSGFDLCRLMVGSLGTLGILAEVVLRSVPSPPEARWYSGDVEPWSLPGRLYRPSCVLWDGCRTKVLLEGAPGDIDAEATALGVAFAECGPPERVPSAGRLSVRPSRLEEACVQHQAGTFLAEVGVGVVHLDSPVTPAGVEPSSSALHRRLKAQFDPRGRLNPGRSVGAT